MGTVRSKPKVKRQDEAVVLLKKLANHYYVRDDRTMCEFAIELLHIHYERKFEPLDEQVGKVFSADEASDTVGPSPA